MYLLYKVTMCLRKQFLLISETLHLVFKIHVLNFMKAYYYIYVPSMTKVSVTYRHVNTKHARLEHRGWNTHIPSGVGVRRTVHVYRD